MCLRPLGLCVLWAVAFALWGMAALAGDLRLSADRSLDVGLSHMTNAQGREGATRPSDALDAWGAGGFTVATADRLGVNSGVHWLRIGLHNPTDGTTTHHLDLNRPFQALARVYLVQNGETSLILQEARDQPFTQRLMLTRQLISLPIEIAPNGTAVLWIAHSVDGSAVPNWTLLTPQDLQTQTTQATVFLSVFYMTALVIAVFMLGFVLVLRTRTQVYYLGFFVFLLAYNAQLDGVLLQYLWPGMPVWNAHASHIIGLIGVALASLAAQSFVDARRRYPLYYRTVQGFVVLTAGFLVLPLVIPIGVVKVWAGPLMLVFLLLHFTGAFLSVRDRSGGWLLFVLGSLVLIGYLGVFTIGTQAGLLPPLVLATIVRYGQLLDGALFSASAIVQTIGLRRMAEQHQQTSQDLQQLLTATRHDLQQPLLAMRATLQDLQTREGTLDEAKNLAQSIAFLEGLATAQDDPEATQAPQAAPISLVLDGIDTMLTPEAQAAGVDLRVVRCDADFTGDTLIMMRAVANLVTNALRHSGSDRVLVGVRRHPGTLTVVVADRGRGFDPDAVEPDDLGHGIGLAATRHALAQQGWHLSHTRSAGGVTLATISGLRRRQPA